MSRETEPVAGAQPEPEPIPLDREDFMFQLEGHIDFLKNAYFEIQVATIKKLQVLGEEIAKAENIKAKIFKYEEMGLAIEFYQMGDDLKFQAKKRKPMGFSVRNNIPEPISIRGENGFPQEE